LPFKTSLSVFLVGIVQVNRTCSPVRVAARSLTCTGKFKDGGSGDPGIPHPASKAPKLANPAIHTLPRTQVIAISVYWNTATEPSWYS
jgi:hypothetical protein